MSIILNNPWENAFKQISGEIKTVNMKIRHTFIVILLLLSLGLTAQPPEIVYEGTVIAEGFQQGILATDGPFPIGFNFTFFGDLTPLTQFYVSANGLVMFTEPGDLYDTEVSIPNSAAPNNFIAPFWDNLSIVDGGKILYKTIGAAPNRKCIIQFKNMGFDPIPTPLGTFFVILYEGSNVIQIQYRLIVDAYSPASHGESATIGLENSDGSSGYLYAFHDENAVTTENAISFTPSGLTYTANSDAIYDGVYLTSNIAIPDPGIVNFLNPPADAVIGADQTFEWSAAANASSYILLIDTYSSLATATYYYPGLNLTYDITDLPLDQTYYWAVFSSNGTITTWCEVRRFSTTSVPPLVPSPQTVWAEQGQDETIKLNYTGGDTSPKTAIITSLPAQGQLFQYNAGVRGSPISTVETTVTDAAMNVIYAASGSAGNGVGNFNFLINDWTGDSSEGTITVNVSPPGVPNVLYFAKSTNVEIQFDIQMADPTGKQDQFTVLANGTDVPITSVNLKEGDPNTIVLNLGASLVDPVLVSYTPGTVTGSTGGYLLPFTDELVTLTAQAITWGQSLIRKYNESPLILTATAPGGPITYSSSNLSVATVSNNVLTFHTIGTSSITARQAGNASYAPAKFIKALSVAKGDQVITFSALPAKTYGDADFSPGATASSTLEVSYSSDNTSVATIAGGMIHIVGAGSAVITASQSGNFLWNPALDVQQTLNVSKAALMATADDKIKTYGEVNPTLTISYTGFIGTDNESVLDIQATIATTALQYSDVALYPINVSGGSDNNYNLNYTDGSLTIDKAPLTVTADDLTRIYGDPNPTLTISYSGFVNGEDESVIDSEPLASTTADQTTDVGTVAIDVSGGDDNNYSFSYTDGELAIEKASLTVTADDKTRIYGDLNPTLTFSYSGFVNGEDESVIDSEPVASTTADQTTDVGTVAIDVSGGVDNNYSFTYVSGTLTITQASATITLESLMTTYNGLPQPASATTTPADLNVDFTYDGSSTIPVNAESYAVIATINDANYNGTASGTLIINKANLTVAAENKSKTYGDVNPTLTITYTGLVGTDDEAVLDVPATVTTTALQNSDAGSYPIIASGGSDNNYTYIYINGTLTVAKLQQTITITDYPVKLLVGDSYTLTATSTSGLTVLFESSDTDLATIAGDQVTGAAKGDVQIRAYHQGDANYDAAEDFVTIEIYSTHKDVMHLFTPNNDGFNDQWELPGLATWGKCDVRVFNRWGKLVYSNPDYNNLWDGTSNGSPLPEGPYYFVIKTENAGTVKGTVNIVR